MTAAEAETTSAEAELESLLQFLYQCPVGLLELDDTGAIRMVNPAASRMLASVLDPLDPSLLPVLERYGPDLVPLVTQDLDRLGPLSSGSRLLVPDGTSEQLSLEPLLVRVDRGRLMMSLVDVSAERRVAQREHEIVLGLQKAMLGRIDSVPGLSVGVAYHVAEIERQVGGDWYDLVDLGTGRVGLVIGDVVGHNLEAAAAMGQLRSAVRSLALTHRDPGDLLAQADRFAEQVDGAACTTMTYAVLDRTTGRLQHASAGHPPPLVLRADGRTEYLWGGRERPLACTEVVPRDSADDLLEPGDVLVLYTDGLVERRRTTLSEGLDRLCATAAELRDLPANELCQGLTAAMLSDGPAVDDVCLLVVRHAPLA